MKLLRYLVLPLAILSIMIAQAQQCAVWAFLRIDRGEGDIEEHWPMYGQAEVFMMGPGETAEYVFWSGGGDCGGIGTQLSLNGNIVFTGPLPVGELTVPLTQEGLYAPKFTTGPMTFEIVLSGEAPFFLSFSAPPLPITLFAKVWLDGPYDPSTQLMGDGLRAYNLIPPTYDGVTLNPSVLAVTGPNAIVDRIDVTVRRLGSNVWHWAALLQRDGDIVTTDGVSPLSLTVPAGDYSVMVRHRNHLGCTTLPMPFTANTTVDLRSPSVATYGTEARKTVGTMRTLWPGSTGSSDAYPKRISYTGAFNDRDPILARIGGTIPTNTVVGYYLEDVNLDGVVKYTGANNDRDPILTTIGGTVPTVVRMEQIP